LSGFAGLVYQVVWQRSLYAIFGINIESVTLIVAIFLLGLGLGSLLGGAISRRTTRLLAIFAVAELGVGLYGFFSLEIFRQIGPLSFRFPTGLSAVFVFGLLLLPTLLMGLTLPLLVNLRVSQGQTTGTAVADLYFANTAGAAVAALLTVVVLLPLAGQQGTVTIAAAINFIVGGLVVARVVKSAAE
jgi:predicted membrane-bound spermidine synthase